MLYCSLPVTHYYCMPQTTAQKTKATKATKEAKSKETAESDLNSVFKGREYFQAVGRRKTSVAQVRIYDKGEGHIVVNGVKLSDYLDEGRLIIAKQPLKTTSHLKDVDVSIVVKGSGLNGQAEAIRHGISRALVKYDKELKPALKAKGWLTRDDRRKERKKPGLKKARRAPQWSKR